MQNLPEAHNFMKVTGFLIIFNLMAMNHPLKSKPPSTLNLDTVVLGGGCFWCIEAVFENLEGVVSVTSGYSGGTNQNPDYESVCSGTTGHAEVCEIVYDPSRIDFTTLLEVFFNSHDPTTLNRQGNDIGTQYRSVIFYTGLKQFEASREYIQRLATQVVFSAPICTQLAPLKHFYKAEPYHQNYYKLNSQQGYCRVIISPKLKALQKKFPTIYKK